MSVAKLTSKGQITIPKSIRERFGLRTGDRVKFVVDPKGALVMEPVNAEGERRPLAGFLQDRVRISAPVTTEDMDRGIAEAVRQRYLRSRRDSDGADD